MRSARKMATAMATRLNTRGRREDGTDMFGETFKVSKANKTVTRNSWVCQRSYSL